MRKLLKKYRPTCDQVAFLPVGSTGSHASTTISRSPTSHRTEQGGRLVELHRDWAVIELAANGSRRVFERRRVDAGNVTLPWIERGRRPGDV
jgi:hypothetical protein